ncbi:MAG: hypothetical protein R6U69_05885 [Marinobacter sp.]|uniref:hypothetical protein n=1 Tax=Marinobacter sp. TaxID=50741 RepID=UPI003564861B
MSLLNDALRAAEQRQNRPAAPGAYVGEQQRPGNSKPLLTALLVVLLLLIAATAGYWAFANSSSSSPTVAEGEPTQDQAVQREAVVIVDEEQNAEPVEVQTPDPVPEVVEVEPAPRQDPEPVVAQQPEPEVAEPETTASEPDTTPAPVADAPDTKPTKTVEAEEAETEETSTAGVKQVPETPDARDRSTARELERLVADGRITDAERGLAAITREQTAPRSRYVVARALLVEGRQDQALDWLPEDMAVQHPKLRLLRARAQHANKNLAAALDTLNSNVPPVEGHAEYRVTLATLLQQQGENGEAARHWAELIAWDDSKGAWWVGLAISLEAQGEQVGAARAYQQAAELPGLPRSLADYVQRRLQALRAG